MKKILLSITLLTALTISAKAQLILGIKGGANFSKLNTDNLKESTLTGYQVGFFIRGGSSFFIQPEIYLSSTGGKFNFQPTSSAGYEEAKARFTNLNIPLLFGKSFGQKSLNFRIMAGPVYTAVLDKDLTFSQAFQNTYNDIGHYKNGTLGYQAGVGIDIGSVTLDGRYEGGLTKINQDYGQRQNLFAVSVGYKFL